MWMVLLFAGFGCDVCNTPAELDGRTFSVFATPRTYEIGGLEDAFPAEGSPANGPLEIGFDWVSEIPMAPVTVTLDGQVYEDGTGQWSEVNCGNFTARWGGTYSAEDGSEHVFVAAGFFSAYGDGELEGFVDWSENWQASDGRQGSFSSEVLMRTEGR